MGTIRRVSKLILRVGGVTAIYLFLCYYFYTSIQSNQPNLFIAYFFSVDRSTLEKPQS